MLICLKHDEEDQMTREDAYTGNPHEDDNNMGYESWNPNMDYYDEWKQEQLDKELNDEQD